MVINHNLMISHQLLVINDEIVVRWLIINNYLLFIVFSPLLVRHWRQVVSYGRILRERGRGSSS